MNLIQTGHWYWRQDELSLKEFHNLSSTDREEYLVLLQGLKEKSTTDNIILNKFNIKPEQKKFLSLDELE